MTAQAAPANARQPGGYQWLNRYPKGVDWHQKITPAPLYQLLDDARHPEIEQRECPPHVGDVYRLEVPIEHQHGSVCHPCNIAGPKPTSKSPVG